MVTCKKCGNELPDDSIFCSKCGLKMDKTTDGNLVVSFKKLNKKFIILGLIGIILVGAVITTVIILNNPIGRFKGAINDNKYVEASEIYTKKIKGNISEETAVTNFLKSDIETIKKDFIENKLEYNVANSKLDTIDKTGLLSSEVSSVRNEINKLNDSRIAFKKGEEFLKGKNYKEAFNELKKVIKEDKNYSKAQELINGSIKDYKAMVLSDAEASVNKSDFDNAISSLNEALTVIPNDSDISAKKAIYEKQNGEKIASEHKRKMEDLQKNQEVYIVSTRQYTDIIDTNYIAVVVQNNTADKTVKSYDLSFMAYDKNNLPIKVGLGVENFVGNGHNDQNILPRQKLDSSGGWYLDNHQVKKLIACIEKVEYYDGSVWENPYYEYWLEEYKEKPLH